MLIRSLQKHIFAEEIRLLSRHFIFRISGNRDPHEYLENFDTGTLVADGKNYLIDPDKSLALSRFASIREIRGLKKGPR
jgi:hypothetical protein